jgi:hypothetical protein
MKENQRIGSVQKVETPFFRSKRVTARREVDHHGSR